MNRDCKVKGRPLPQFALQTQITTMHLDEATTNGKAQPATLTPLPGLVPHLTKFFEHLRLVRFGNANTGIDHFHLQ